MEGLGIHIADALVTPAPAPNIPRAGEHCLKPPLLIRPILAPQA